LTRTRNRKLTIRQRRKLSKLELRPRKTLRKPNRNLKLVVISKKLLWYWISPKGDLLKRQRYLRKNLTKTNPNLNLNSLMTVLGTGICMTIKAMKRILK
jgi:hypothetical protein